jgi:parallel beta-helix repeat protein
VDPESREITLSHPVAGRIHEGNRYFVQNLLGALDAPGEWYLDAKSGRLTFMPPGAALGDGEVLAPVLENLVLFSGTAAEPVRWLNLRGFDLAYAEQDAVVLEGAEHCEITGNRIRQIGGVGINAGFLRNASPGVGNRWVKGGRLRQALHSGDRALLVSHPCSDCRIAGNDVDDCGGDGIVLSGERNTADNNHVSRVGVFDRVCAGVTVCGNDNTIAHHSIHDVPRDGLFINGARNTAEYNAIRYSMLDTADNSGIALRQHDVAKAVRDRGNVLRFNRILDTVGYGSYPHCVHPPKGYGAPFASWGIYLDGSISGVTVYGNVVARSGANSLFVQFGGGNLIENNIFVETLESTVQYGSVVFFGWFMHVDTTGQFNEPPNELRRNIFYYSGKERMLYQSTLWGHPEWNEKGVVFDHNLIWHQGEPVDIELDPQRTYHTFADWQKTGQDAHSLVADPQFADAAADDYRLAPTSPAFGLGFKDINTELGKIGPYASPERATWPLPDLAAQREQPLTFAYTKPPRPIIDGFELVPVGQPPRRANLIDDGRALVAATADVAASGQRSLRIGDAAGLQYPYSPHLWYALGEREGALRLSVEIMNSAEMPAAWYMEFRDWSGDLYIGPTFAGSPDGTLTCGGRFGVGGRPLLTVPLGTWFTVTLDLRTGADAPRSYALTVQPRGGAPQTFTDLPFADAGFQHATWFGISSTSTTRTAFWVDSLVLGAPDDPQVRDPSTVPAFRGDTRTAAVATEFRNPERLVCHWNFEETDGELLKDVSGNGLDADIGGTQRVRGSFGQALLLDGSSAGMELADTPLIHFGKEAFSLDFWLCPQGLAIDSPHPRRRLFDKGQWPDVWWNVDILSDGRIRMELGDGSGPGGTTESDTGLADHAWSHVAIVVDRDQRLTRTYVNGALVGAKALPAGFTTRFDTPGKAFTTGGWQPFQGLLDELRIYRRVLTPEEIRGRWEAMRSRYTQTDYQGDEE